MEKYNVLWTGGWDSTFRVLDLVITKGKVVQPYYIKDSGRKSTQMEINTMEKIKQMIAKNHSASKGKVLDTIFIDVATIPSNNQITKDYKFLSNKFSIGSQYDWLARYAEDKKLNGLELSIHIDDTAFPVIENDIEEVETEDDHYFKLKDDKTYQEVEVFSRFHFPILKLSKIDMELKSKERGYFDIMEQTWFCHNPQGNKPCGLCNPCKYTRDEGLGRRVPNPSIKLRVGKFAKKVKSKLLK